VAAAPQPVRDMPSAQVRRSAEVRRRRPARRPPLSYHLPCRAPALGPGNIIFEWSKSVANPHEFVLVEAFQDDAGGAHVNSAHFKEAMAWMPDVVAETPRIVNVRAEGDGWGEMAEVQPRP
jgi:hypothetical protein